MRSMVWVWLIVFAETTVGEATVSVSRLFAKHGINWGHIITYEGRNTVPGILHELFPTDDGKKILAELGFQQGIVPDDGMIDSLRHMVENDPQIVAIKDWQEPINRLAISAKTEKVLAELTETIISTDDSLSSGQKTGLHNALALRDSSTTMKIETINQAIEAIQNCDRQTLAIMIDSGTLDPNLPIVSGMPLLGFAARILATRERSDQQKSNEKQKLNDSIDQLRWLATHPRVDLNATDNQGRNFIGMAAKQGSFNALKIALDIGMDVNSIDGNGDTPLLIHLQFGSGGYWEKTVKFLVEEHNASITISNVWGTTALHKIVSFEGRWGGTELTNYFLDRGADINAYSRLAGRPLDIATKGQNHQLIALLLKHGAQGALYPNGAPKNH